MFVLDCSVTMAWCFEDESSVYSDLVLDILQEKEAIVPNIWSLEVSNVLVVAERKKRIKESEVYRFMHLLDNLPINIDDKTHIKSFNDILSLAREHMLSSYDAAYLELAIREGVAIATLDEKLKKIAETLGLKNLEFMNNFD